MSVFTPVVYTYSPTHVILTVGITPVLDWDEISISYTRPQATTVVGVYGRRARKVTMQRLARLSVTYKATALSNLISELWSKFTIDTRTQGFVPVTLTDLWSGTIFAMYKAIVLPPEETTYKASVSSKTWVLEGYASIDINNTLSLAQQINQRFVM